MELGMSKEYLTNKEAAKRVLEEAGTPLKYRDIYRRARENGYLPPPDKEKRKTPAATLRTEMGRHEDIFVRISTSTYALVEWGLHKQETKTDELLLKSTSDSGRVDIVQKSLELVTQKKQIILFGPPGTSKTWYAKIIGMRLASTIDGVEKSTKFRDASWIDDHLEIVQFHPSYSYDG
ncbi:MAG: hypothetical protein GF411_04095, partial [Candidatus Lokiarchaeota archaeon]|nr:hypothetical protein [Candidatus Lokiarchaeota archaeon]